MILADSITDVATHGVQYGPLGWVLAVIFVMVGVYTWAVFLPERKQDREQKKSEFEADQKRKEALNAAVIKLCDVTGDTHIVVTGISTAVDLSKVRIGRLVGFCRAIYEVLKAIDVKIDGAASEPLGAARESLRELGDETEEHSPLDDPPHPKK